jgi:PAS domain-containing protein
VPGKSTVNGSSLESEIEALRQRVTELESELSLRAAASSEDGYRYTVELNPHVTWTANAAGRVEDINQRWLDLTGLPREHKRSETVGHELSIRKTCQPWRRRGDRRSVRETRMMWSTGCSSRMEDIAGCARAPSSAAICAAT